MRQHQVNTCSLYLYSSSRDIHGSGHSQTVISITACVFQTGTARLSPPQGPAEARGDPWEPRACRAPSSPTTRAFPLPTTFEHTTSLPSVRFLLTTGFNLDRRERPRTYRSLVKSSVHEKFWCRAFVFSDINDINDIKDLILLEMMKRTCEKLTIIFNINCKHLFSFICKS